MNATIHSNKTRYENYFDDNGQQYGSTYRIGRKEDTKLAGRWNTTRWIREVSRDGKPLDLLMCRKIFDTLEEARAWIKASPNMMLVKLGIDPKNHCHFEFALIVGTPADVAEMTDEELRKQSLLYGIGG